MKSTSLFTVVVTFVAVMVLDFRLILALIVLCVIQFLYYRKIVEKDKKEVWDELSDSWRKTDYMERVTQYCDHAKEIRLFNLSEFLSKKQEETYLDKEEKMDLHHELWFKNSFVTQIATELIKDCNYAYEYVLFMEYPEALPKGEKEISKKPHEIEFMHVSFSYPGTDKKILDDISIKIRPGEHLSIVGLNGAGKTTFIKLQVL